MQLTAREATQKDFEAWFDMECACFGFSEEIRPRTKREWDTLIASPSLLTVVVEDAGRPPESLLVGFGAGAFVSDRFTQWLKSGQPPHSVGHATRPLPDGSWPLLNALQIRAANSGDGLNFLLTHWVWAEHILSDTDNVRVRNFLTEHFIEFHSGYNLKEILIEVVGAGPLKRAREAGFLLLDDYAEHYRTQGPPPQFYPYLMGLTRAEALANDGCAISPLFLYTPPRFFFDAEEQEFLRCARFGRTDDEIASELYIAEGTVKKRWREIYERVSEVDPNLLPPVTDTVRGTEKRRKLLRYLREHPEELRPYKPPLTSHAVVSQRSPRSAEPSAHPAK
jgi:hypothetical protein